ncbi:MAG: IgGFc-binding protein [Kofleriaceae bacterium]|nr:IgGFc-binding protein [Kofleriaceae bacterium]
MATLTQLASSALVAYSLLGCGAKIGGGVDVDADEPCVTGVQRCTENTLESCSDGSWTTSQECTGVCSPALGCVTCIPGTGTCSGDTATTCRVDGSGFDDIACDPDIGISCSGGSCQGACAPATLGRSYIGCEYFPTVTAQAVSTDFSYSVVISNTGGVPAQVRIEGGALAAPLTLTVAPQEVKVQDLPWVPALKICNGGGMNGCTNPNAFVVGQVTNGSYHLKSTQPVTVYQFSPKDYTNGASFTFTNDASLLLPTNAMTGNYVVASYPFWNQFNYPGLMAVTAVRDNTTVTITPTAPSSGTPTFPVGVATPVVLQKGDVIQILNTSGDLTGSKVSADKPVQVIGGHYCTNVPSNVVACDHLEESMFPTETLSTEYLVTAPAVPSIPNGKEEVIRIIAIEANTNLTYDPPLPSAPTTIPNAGGYAQIARQPGDYKITADKRIMIAQYMEGQAAGGNTGDPAMTLTVAIDQYRSEYLFHAPTNYVTNYVNVTAPTGATVMLDGTAIADWTPIGNSGFSVARVVLGAGPLNDGSHSATSSDPFGISVYGYGDYTSYWYPGGLNLDAIVVD